jgi:hypothetical protein
MAEFIYPNAGDWIGALEAGTKARMTRERNQAQQTYGQGLMTGDWKGAAGAVAGFDPELAVNTLKYGETQDQQARTKGYGQTFTADPQAAVKAAQGAGDFEIAGHLQEAIDAAEQHKLEAAHRKAARVAEIVAPIGEIADIGQRRAFIQQHRDELKDAGYSDQDIDSFEPTDTNLATVYTQAMGLAKYLESKKGVVVGSHLVDPYSGKEIYNGEKYVKVGPDETLIAVGGEGGLAAGAPETDAPAGPTRAKTSGIYGQVGQIAQAAGAKPEEVTYLQRLAEVESSGDPGAQNGRSTGLFQFHPDTFAGVGGKNINDVGEQTKAALALSRRDRENLAQLGVEASDANVYLMHQQGPAGGRALLTAPPEVNAVSVLTPVYGNGEMAKRAIVANGGSPDMSAGQFVSMWRQRWAGAEGGAAQPADGAGLPAGERVVARGAPKAKARPATPEEKAQYGIGADVPAQVTPDGQIHVVTGTGAANRRVPPKIQSGYLENNAGIAQIDQAIALLRQRPKSMGLANLAGDEVRQRLDPDGIKVRAAVANVGAVKIHDLSGAAVTAAETPRLKPFIPMPTDTAEAAIKKLEGLKQQLQNNNSQIEVQFGEESGYMPLTKPKAASAPAASAPPAAKPAAKGAAKPAHQMTDAEIKAALGL